MTGKDEDILEITDENGETRKVELIDIVSVDDIEYAILSPIEEQDDDYVLMRVIKDGEEYSFETIEDDDEFDRVAAYIDEIADETED